MGSWFFSSLSEGWRVLKYSRCSATQKMPSRARGFHRKNFGLCNIRRFGKKLLRFGKQRFGNVSVEMRVAPILISEGIEDSVFSRSQLNRVPAQRALFLLGQRLR